MAKKQKTTKGAVIQAVISTVLVMTILAGAVVYHLISVKNAEKTGFVEGAKTVKEILVK